MIFGAENADRLSENRISRAGTQGQGATVEEACSVWEESHELRCLGSLRLLGSL